MGRFQAKSFQLKTFSSSTEKFFEFNCIAPKNQLKNFTYDTEGRPETHNKPFGLLSHVNSPSTYTLLVNKCKVK